MPLTGTVSSTGTRTSTLTPMDSPVCEEQGIPLQTSGSHGRQVLLRVEDSGEGLVICNEHKIATIQIRVKLTHRPDDGEGFFVDLRVVSLRS